MLLIPEGNSSHERAPQRSFHDVLAQVLEELDQLTDFTIETLNPFVDLEQLKAFSREVNEGEFVELYFDALKGSGEWIQSQYLKKFFAEFFPRISILFDDTLYQSSVNRTRLTLSVRDFYLFPLEKIEAERMIRFPVDSRIPFSITQLKVLHSHTIQEELKMQLKKAFLDELSASSGVKIPLNIPIIVSQFSRSIVDITKKIPGPFLYVTISQSSLIVGLYENGSQKMYRVIDLKQKLVLRGLYAFADRAFIPDSRNKMEGAICGAGVVTESERYLLSENPNWYLDQILQFYGYITTLQDFTLALETQGQAAYYPVIEPLTPGRVAQIYTLYMKNSAQSRGYSYEFSVRECMSYVFAAMLQVQPYKEEEK